MTNNISIASYPNIRMRRNRKSDWSRRLVKENQISVNDLILPIFVTDSEKKTAITSMPGVNRIPINEVVGIVHEAKELGIPAIALFPETNNSLKDENGSEALNEENIVCKATRLIKDNESSIPIVHVRNNIDGFFDRNTYYNLIDYALKNEFIENNSLYVPSRNLNHIIGKIA